MPNTHELDIVGAWHHPPATALFRLLPLNANLWLRADPNNPVDSNAIAVDLDFDLLNLAAKADLKREIQAAFDTWTERHPERPVYFADAEASGLFHLGFISAINALAIKTAFPDFDRRSGTLRFSPKAKPLVRFVL